MHKRIAILAAALLATLANSALAAGVVKEDDRVQVFIGVTELDDQTGELQNDSREPVDIDFANLLAIGMEVETPLHSKDSGFEWGVNAGAGFSWKGDDTRFAGKVDDSGGTVVFKFDNEMLLVEGHIGPYLRAHMGTRADFYLGAGPAIIYGQHSVDDNNDGDPEAEPLANGGATIILGDDSSSDIIIGYYARAGIEFDLGAGKQWGLGMRYLGGEMDFSDTVGKFDLKGYQVLLTYSAWF